MAALSKREWEVLDLLLQGRSNKLIAAGLGISERTVEFHLKNIYAKQQVGSRVELILKLGKTTGPAAAGELGSSTVERQGKIVENGNTPDPDLERATSSNHAVPGRELKMRDLKLKDLISRQVGVGALTALITGFAWIVVFQHFGHMDYSALLLWFVPIFITLMLLGGAVGVVAGRRGMRSRRTFVATLFGTGVGAFAMIPLVAVVVYPLGKFAEWIGLIHRAAFSTELTSGLVIVATLVMWLLAGAVLGILLLSLRAGRSHPNAQPAERGVR